jgi:hypothetical protein
MNLRFVLLICSGQDAPEQPTCVTLVKEEESELQAEPQSQFNTDSNPPQSRSNNHQSYLSVRNDSTLRPRDDKTKPSSFAPKENVSHGSKGKQNSVQHASSKRPQPSNHRGIDSYYRDDIKNKEEDMDTFDGDVDFFDDNVDENFDFDQLDQIEQEVIHSNKPNFNKKPDQQLGSPHVETEFNEVYDDDFMDDDFDFEDFEMDQSQLVCPKMELPGHIKPKDKANVDPSVKTIKSQQNSMPMAKKLKSAMSRTGSVSKTSSTTVIKTERCDESPVNTSSGLLNNSVSAVGNSITNVESNVESNVKHVQRNKQTMKLGVKKSKITCQSTIKINTPQPLVNTIVKKERDIEVINLVDQEDKDVFEGSEELETSLPFTYLSHVLKDLPFPEDRTVRIKVKTDTGTCHGHPSHAKWLNCASAFKKLKM